ncbi:MAG: HipA domain-containing protein [Ignavibacteriales bacterium]|nr:HipA domain-containing protein [Ignavibacteriales bacterium]
MKIKNCPGCLKPNYSSFCPRCVRVIFNDEKIEPIVNIDPELAARTFAVKETRLSISGVQRKHSVVFREGAVKIVISGGRYILKPIPGGRLEYIDFVPANEHLTMQMAKQVFKLKTAECGMLFSKSGEPYYFTKRFDRDISSGKKLIMEDFAQIAGKTEETGGGDYKYSFSYEKMASLIMEFTTAPKIEIEIFFSLIIFNYLFSNGDAHIKNFSIIEDNVTGGRILSPAYDLLSTGIHIPGESDMALDLFEGDFVTTAFKAGSKYTKEDFIVFAQKIGINNKRFTSIYEQFLDRTDKVYEMTDRSFLRDDIKDIYFKRYLERLERLKY